MSEETKIAKTFDPRDHLIKLGKKDYLPVAGRLLWLNFECQNFTIDTELIEMSDKHAVFKATVTITQGQHLRKASSYKREDQNHFPDSVEKACTGAVGRALGMLGFGTQFTDEFDEVTNKTNRQVDTGRETKYSNQKPQHSSANDKQVGVAKLKGIVGMAANALGCQGEALNAKMLEHARAFNPQIQQLAELNDAQATQLKDQFVQMQQQARQQN